MFEAYQVVLLYNHPCVYKPNVQSPMKIILVYLLICKWHGYVQYI